MKKIFSTLLLGFLCGNLAPAQSIPADSLYLAQTLPGSTPVIFDLWTNPGPFATERIAISDDGGEIYYTEVGSYYPVAGDTIRYYRYTGSHWTGPFNLFPNHMAPALSLNSDTLYFQDNNSAPHAMFSVRNGTGWSNPQQLLPGLNSAHYLQVTENRNYYVSTVPGSGIGAADWCRLFMNGTDTMAVSLGLPLNSLGNNLDFFVSRDESFMILAKGGLQVSYHKNDGGWTNPKSLGQQINFGLNEWGPFVSSDHKYLFYTTGTLQNYSDTYIYWVRVDQLLDSLKYTNYVPYLKNPIPAREAILNEWFSFQVPDTTFVDDDGNQTLTYIASLTNNQPLPEWLTFDSLTATFTGTPTDVETLNIRLKAVDPAGASAIATFKISVTPHTSVGPGDGLNDPVRIFPNPTGGKLNILYQSSPGRTTFAELRDLQGHLILSDWFEKELSLDMTNCPGGIYFVRLYDKKQTIIRVIVLEK